MSPDPYHVLGLEPGADPAAVEARYRRLVRRYPPELNPRRFAEVQAAYDLLRSPARQLEAAMADPRGALERLFPEVKLSLAPPPPPPPAPDAAAWSPVLAPLREQAIREVLRGLADQLRSP